MKRKRKLSIYDIGSLAVTPTVDQPRQSLKRFEREEKTRIEAEQAAKEETVRVRLAEIEAPLKAEAREHSRRLKLYWSRPLSDISVNGLELALVDFVGDYEIGPRDTEKENVAWSEFLGNVKSCGCVLSDTGIMRLSWYLSALAFRRGVSLTSIENFAKALERLHSLQVFPAGELENYQQTPTEPERQAVVNPDRRATMDDLLALGDSRQDQRDARRIADELYFDERQPMVRAWFDSLRKFGIVITHTDADYCKKWFQRNNKSFLIPAHFNECRRHMVASHRWPVSCLTNLEAFELSLETIETSQLTVSQRNDLRRREQAAREADAQRFGK